MGLPDTVDRYRTVSHDPKPPTGRKGDARPLQEPGTYWEYNDVRINQLSLARMHLFDAPLPQVLRETIMQPIGTNENWKWKAYDDAWVDLSARGVGPRRVQSVPGVRIGVVACQSAHGIRRWWDSCAWMVVGMAHLKFFRLVG